jgi:hypothetical protein
VAQAAQELGMSPMAVRVRMERGLLDIGECFPTVTGNRTSYYIYRDKLNKVLGKEERR